ncbi:MAG: Amuc_1102 family pilus-like protein [Verrucomicrobiota bacterium]
MKKASIFLLALFALAAGAFARDDYAISQIKANFPNTPQISFGGAPAKPFTPQTWLEVEVEFKSNVDFAEELTFKYYIYLDVKKCLVGTVTHVNVPKGNSLFSVMYVSPGTLARLAGGKFSKNVQEVTVQILDKGQVVAQKSMKGTPGEWWSKLDQPAGLVWNKNQTPFSSLYWDHYVEIKPSAN